MIFGKLTCFLVESGHHHRCTYRDPIYPRALYLTLCKGKVDFFLCHLVLHLVYLLQYNNIVSAKYPEVEQVLRHTSSSVEPPTSSTGPSTPATSLVLVLLDNVIQRKINLVSHLYICACKPSIQDNQNS